MTPDQGLPGNEVKSKPHFIPRHSHLEEGSLFLLYPKMICELEQPCRGSQGLHGPAWTEHRSRRESYWEDISRHKRWA